jgi:hypothetical protein
LEFYVADFRPPLTEQSIEPLMHIDQLSGALALYIDPYAGSIHSLPTIIELPQPPQVPSVGEVNNVEDVPTYTTVTLLSPRAPHGQNKRTTPTLKQQKKFKRLQVPLRNDALPPLSLPHT